MLSKRSKKLLSRFSKQRTPMIPKNSFSACVDQLLQENYIVPVYPDYDYEDELFLERGRSPIGYRITEAGRGYLTEHSSKRANVSLCLSVLAIAISVLSNLPEIISSVDWIVSAVLKLLC